MKKLLLLLLVSAFATSLFAETLFDYTRKIGTFVVSGTTTEDVVKIHTNKDAVPGIKFANSYMKEGAFNENYAYIKCEGGFKKGDIITVAGAYNNSAEKTSAVDFFLPIDNTPTVLFTTKQFINGRLVDDDPEEETFTLTEDCDSLFFGRNGNTGTFVTTLKVVRGDETPEEPEPEIDALVHYEKNKGDFTDYGSCSVNDAVKINENSKSVAAIKFSNSYKTDNLINENYVTVECDGGFLTGDIITIAGAYNNDDEKDARIHIFTLDEANNINLLFETQPFINGRTSKDDPVKEQFILSEDVEMLCLGRQGNTGTYVTTFIVERPVSGVKSGDVNEDDEVNINDVVAIINVMAGTAEWPNANVNGDPEGNVDINDVVAVINIMAGL